MKLKKPPIYNLFLIILSFHYLGCEETTNYPTKVLTKTPDPTSHSAAQSFLQNHPSSQVFFSQNSGRILLLSALEGVLFPGQSSNAEEAFETLLQFFESYPDLFQIKFPRLELQIAEDLASDGKDFKRHPSHGTYALRVEQVY
jgi:hypothetical protein